MEFINQIFEFKVEPFLLFLYLYFCLWPIVCWDHLFCNLSYEWQGLWIIEVSNFSIATMIPIWIIPKSKGYGPRIKTNDLVLLRSVLFVKSFGSVEVGRCFFTYWSHHLIIGTPRYPKPATQDHFLKFIGVQPDHHAFPCQFLGFFFFSAFPGLGFIGFLRTLVIFLFQPARCFFSFCEKKTMTMYKTREFLCSISQISFSVNHGPSSSLFWRWLQRPQTRIRLVRNQIFTICHCM